MTKEAERLIERYINLIDNEDWKTFYQHVTLDAHPVKRADKEIIGQVTAILLQSGINPLLWMEDIPNNFLNSTMKIKSIHIPDNIYWIGKRAFYDSRLEDLDLSNTIVQSIETEAFRDCQDLEKVIFSNKLMRIDVRAFANCYSLIEITLPKSIELIQFNAFQDCYNIKSITYEGTSKQLQENVMIANNAFYDCEAEYIKCADGKNVYLEDLK